LTKDDYRVRARDLLQALLSAQVDLRETQTSALFLFSGVDGAGKGETVQLLNEWMDPRWIRTHAFDEPTTDETERPAFWRYWRRLPPHGEIAIFLSAWYSTALLDRVNGGSDASLEAALEQINRFERMLTDDGMMIFKLWLHIDGETQARRFRELEADPRLSWRVTQRDWDNWSRCEEFTNAAERIIDETHTDACDWHVIEGSDGHRRNIEVGDALLAALRAHTVAHGGAPRRVEKSTNGDEPVPSVSRIGALKGVKKCPRTTSASPVSRSCAHS
jgi:polyphosphate kinase 2 (PPK2 family)